ncbi:MAG: ATP-binding protein, partial [Candidatus Hodarchaeota archaeon]
MTPNTTPPFYRFDLIYGPVFYSHLFYNYLLLIIGFSILTQTYMTSTKGVLYRKQVLFMIVGASFPSVVTLIRILNLIPSIQFLDLTPFSFIVTFILYYYVLFEYDLLLHMPISLHRVFESINDGVIVLNRDFRIMNINQSAGLNFLSISKDEISNIHGKDFLQAITNVEKQSNIKIDTSKLHQGLDFLQKKEIENFECGIKIHKPGQSLPKAYFSVSMTPVLQSNQDIIGYILNLRDITELKEKEELLRKSEEHYRTLTHNLNVGVFRAHMYGYMDTKIVEMNPAFLEMLGYANLEEIEQVGRAALFATHEERVRFNDEMIEKGRVTNLEIGLRKKNGTIFSASISSVIIRDEDKGFAIWDGTVEDISERKAAEYRANFLDSLLRHDISNKIHIINGYLTLLRRSELEEGDKKLVEKALKGTEEGMTLIQKIRKLREIDQAEPSQQLDLIKVLKKVIDLHADQAVTEGMKIIFDDQNKSFDVLGGELLYELFSNLIENALNHSNGTMLQISVQETMSDHIIITLEDDGKGIPDEIVHKIFERGTKGPKSKGSGLGLFLVKTIAEAYGGKITLEDSNLGGVSFQIVLNRA